MRRLKDRPRLNGPTIGLIITLFILITAGLVILYSVSGPIGYSNRDRDSLFFVRHQLQYTALGLVGVFILTRLPLDFLKSRFVWMGSYIASLGLLVLTAAVGVSQNGAKRWLGTETTNIQTSELVKIGLVISLAGYRRYYLEQKASGKKFVAKNPKNQAVTDFFFEFLVPVGLAGLCDALILVQPHASCAAIVAFVVFMCVVSSGIKPQSWLVGIPSVLLIGALAIGAVAILNPDYIKENFAHVFKRFEIAAALKGDEDEQADSNITSDDLRQVENAHNALGSGGMMGVGFGKSRSKYSYVSEAQNDYIFSVFIEETGFVGGVMLIGVYIAFFYQCLKIIQRLKDVFSRTIVTGYASLIMIEVILNLTVNLQVFGISTGVTLPFVSYGGTAQVFLLAAYGMILSISSRCIEDPKEEHKAPKRARMPEQRREAVVDEV